MNTHHMPMSSHHKKTTSMISFGFFPEDLSMLHSKNSTNFTHTRPLNYKKACNRLLYSLIVAILLSFSLASCGDFTGTIIHGVIQLPTQENWNLINSQLPARQGHNLVVLNDVIYMIGGEVNHSKKNDVWKSSDGVTWTQILTHSDSPSPQQFPARSGHSAVVLGNKIYVIGGNESGTLSNAVWYSPDGIIWTKTSAPTPAATTFTARENHSSVVIGTNIYVIGGYASDSMLKNDIWTSNDEGKTWNDIPITASNTRFTARENHSSVVLGGEIYVIGGYDGAYLNDVWVLDDTGNTLRSKDEVGFSIRSRHSAIVHKNKVFVIAGGSNTERKNDVWSSENGTTWKKVKPNDKTGFSTRVKHAAVVLDEDIFVIGGSHDFEENTLNDVFQSSDEGASWTEIPTKAIPIDNNIIFPPRTGHVTVRNNNTIYTIGGETDTGTYLNDVWKSNDGGLIWTRVPTTAQFTARRNHSAVIVNDTIYIIGGYNNAYLNDTWTSNDGGVIWKNLNLNPNFNQPSNVVGARESHSSVVKNSNIYVLGGYDSTYLNDVWVLQNIHDHAMSEWQQIIISSSSTQFSARANHSSVVLPIGENSQAAALGTDTIFIIGGKNNETDLDDTWTSTDGKTWTKVSTITSFSARSDHSAVITNDQFIFVIGGKYTNTYLNDVWGSKDYGVTWTEYISAVKFFPRANHQSIALGKKIFVIAGNNEKNLNDIWTWTPTLAK